MLDFGLAKYLAAEPATQLAVVTPGPRTTPIAATTAGQSMAATQEYTPETAEPMASGSADRLTTTGAVMGTLGYMSPEQLRGQPVDERSDLFLVGAVLYETITGKRAFPGANPKERMAAILSPDVPPLADSSLPAGLEPILQRALARDPVGRYQSAATFLADVRRVSGGESRVAAIDQREPDPEITASAAKQAAAEYYARGRALWLHSGKGSIDQAQELFEQAARLDPGHAPAFAGLAAVHALRFTFTTDPNTLETAVRYARRASEADPRLGEARLWLGYCLFRQGKPLEALVEEQRAMELDPSGFMPPYFAATAFMSACHRGDALRLYERVTGQTATLDPHCWRRQEAVKLYQRAVGLNPQYGWAWLGLGITHLELGSYEDAVRCLQKSVELVREGQNSPAGVEGYLGECMRRSGALAEARRHCLAGLEDVEKSDLMYRDSLRGISFCSLGRTALQQNDVGTAQAAFRQAVLHLRGRPRALGGGHLFVQALAGSARAGEREASFEEALHVFQTHEGFDFSWLWLCSDDITLLELARAARTLRRTAQAQALLEAALDAGSTEAITEVMP